MWSKKPTDFWLHRLNKDGTEIAPAWRRYYHSKDEAIRHHNHMVDVNPGKEIAHNLHVSNELGHFKMKLVGKQIAKAGKKKVRSATMDELIELLDRKGSAASAWMRDEKWEELLGLYNNGADIAVASHSLSRNEDASIWFSRKEEAMKNKGYRLFDKEENFDSLDMVFVRD